ncbi:MAG: PLP-dependent aminotransferase family protein [Desulfomonile tiedjei]|nr:PLP-dependent aminotransferase family protein [Desulfomonile tiedjei]
MTIWHPDIHRKNEPKYLAIANSIDEDVHQGRLNPGDRLPPHRDLADLLGVTVGTVTRGYAEAARRGLVRGDVGRGSYIAVDVRTGDFLTLQEGAGPDFVDLSLAFPPYAQDPDLKAALEKMIRRAHLQEFLQYQPAAGMTRHREAGVKWVARAGVQVKADDVLICSGAQHALTVILCTLFKPGDRILTEELTYPGLKTLAKMLGLRLEPVEMDADGLIPEALEAACAKEGVKALYTIPNLQNPTAATLSEQRRQQIAEIVKRHDLWIIEDDCYGMTLEDVPRPLFAFAAERTFYIGSLSKTVAAGLRVAFLAAPARTVSHLSSAVTHTIWMSSPIPAEIAAMWIEDGTAESVLRAKREEARKRNAIAETQFAGLRYRSKPTGYFLWLELPDHWNASAFEHEALRHQIAVVGAEQFTVGHASAPAAIRVSLTAPRNREQLSRGLAKLRNILESPEAHEKPIL